MWSLLSSGPAGTIASFFFRLGIFPFLSLIVGISLMVWGAGRIRRAGNSSGRFVAVLVFTHLLLVPTLTAVFSFSYALKKTAASILDASEARLSGWASGMAADLVRQQLPAEFSRDAIPVSRIFNLAESRSRQLSGDLPAGVESLFNGRGGGSLAGIEPQHAPQLVEFLFWRSVVDTAHATGLSSITTWDGFVQESSANFRDKARLAFGVVAAGLRAAGRVSLLLLVLLNLVADIGAVLVTLRLSRTAMAPSW